MRLKFTFKLFLAGVTTHWNKLRQTVIILYYPGKQKKYIYICTRLVIKCEWTFSDIYRKYSAARNPLLLCDSSRTGSSKDCANPAENSCGKSELTEKKKTSSNLCTYACWCVLFVYSARFRVISVPNLCVVKLMSLAILILLLLGYYNV